MLKVISWSTRRLQEAADIISACFSNHAPEAQLVVFKKPGKRDNGFFDVTQVAGAIHMHFTLQPKWAISESLSLCHLLPNESGKDFDETSRVLARDRSTCDASAESEGFLSGSGRRTIAQRRQPMHSSIRSRAWNVAPRCWRWKPSGTGRTLSGPTTAPPAEHVSTIHIWS